MHNNETPLSKLVGEWTRWEENSPPQTPHSMHHASLTSPPTNLRGHIHKTPNLLPHVPSFDILPILAPLAAKDTSLRSILRQRRHRVADIR